MEGARVFERLSAIGATAQAAVPGVYAWGVTVAPSGYSRGASGVARATAIVALAALGFGVLAERRWGARARIASLWAFVASCAATWLAAPRTLSPARLEVPYGLAGVLAWALFAFASCAPAAPMRPTSGVGPPLAVPQRLSGSDTAYLVCGTFLAGLLEAVGWGIAGAERALLVRFIALAAGLAIIGASAQVALARHIPRTVLPSSRRLRRAAAALVLLGLVALSGLLVLALD